MIVSGHVIIYKFRRMNYFHSIKTCVNITICY